MTKSTQSIAKQVRLGDLSLDYNWSDIGEQQAVELIELATRNVRLSHKPMTTPQYENLVIPEGYIKSGTGYASMDLAYFQRPQMQKRTVLLILWRLMPRNLCELHVLGRSRVRKMAGTMCRLFMIQP